MRAAELFFKANCLAKLIVDTSRSELVVGLHFIGPNAGEVVQGFAVAICTNKPEGLALELLRRLGVLDLFGAMVGGDTLAVRKPDPAPYIAAVTRAGGTVARSMLVGDTETDRTTGLAAGVPVALVTFGPEGQGVARLNPEALLRRYDELPGIAARLVP